MIDQTVGGFLTLVMDRRDALGDQAEAADIRLSLLASEIEARQATRPADDAARYGLAASFGITPTAGPMGDHAARQLREIEGAAARLRDGAGPADRPTILAALKAARQLVSHPPEVDDRQVLVTIARCQLGGGDGYAPAGLCSSDDPPDDESEDDPDGHDE